MVLLNTIDLVLIKLVNKLTCIISSEGCDKFLSEKQKNKLIEKAFDKVFERGVWDGKGN
jgi:hypothetical protein